MIIRGHCEAPVRWQLRLLHTLLLARLKSNAPKRLAPQIAKVITLLEQTEVHMSRTLQTTAGQAWFGKNRIDLHYRLLKDRADDLDNTYAHELGHLIAFLLFRECSHGTKWKIVMHWLEANPERTHDIDVSAFRKPVERVREAA